MSGEVWRGPSAADLQGPHRFAEFFRDMPILDGGRTQAAFDIAKAREVAVAVPPKLLNVLRAPYHLSPPVTANALILEISASIGATLFPQDNSDAETLMRHAGHALYRVKHAGRNGLRFFDTAKRLRNEASLIEMARVQQALDGGELQLHYQPKIDVRSARMVGVEALMRWRRGDTLVAPGEFIPLAEETGLIVPLSEWALREAARQAKVWQLNFGFSEAIAVNLPNRLFERSDLVEHIHQFVSAQGVPHRVIQLEITETGLMKDLQSVIPSLHRLNEVGVQISIDDFGTGYSSLAYLTTLPISEVKIDRSFVRDLGITPQSSAVVTAIIALARSLGLSVVAEGVETLRQMEVLRRLDCSLMQGFLFSRPLPPDELERWLTQTVLARRASWILPPTATLATGAAE